MFIGECLSIHFSNAADESETVFGALAVIGHDICTS